MRLSLRCQPLLRPALAFVLVSLASLGARAQTTGTAGTFVSTLSAPANGIQTIPSLSKLDCTAATQDSLIASWTLQFVSGQTENVWLSKTESCATLPTTQDVTEGSVLFLRQSVNRGSFVTAGSAAGQEQYPQQNNSDESLSARRIYDFLGANCPTVDTSVFFCVRIETPSTAASFSSTMSSSLKIALDSTPPATPINVTAAPLENGLTVSWDMPQNLLGATHYHVFAANPDGTVAAQTTVTGSDTHTADLNGLTNGVNYSVTVTALDDAGTRLERNNESPASTAATGMPTEVTDFWEEYKAGGGKETGGCRTGGGSVLALLPIGFLLLRRRRTAAVAALALGLGLAGRAEAQTTTEDGAISIATAPNGKPWHLQSPRHYTLELHIGEYKPNIDEEAGLTTKPYKDVFGGNSHLFWRLGGAVDLFDRFGRLSLGVQTGFWQAVGHARSAGGTATRDTVLLTLVPITPELTYRADFLWERWQIPLVPYARLGWGFVWWQSEIHGKTSTVAGEQGQGWAQGVEYGGGLQFVLDALEPDKAASLDQDFGINSTSLYVEYAGRRWEGAHGLLLHGDIFSGGILFAF